MAYHDATRSRGFLVIQTNAPIAIEAKIEQHHQFTKHVSFGGEGLLRSSDPADQEKAIVYNELVANAVGGWRTFLAESSACNNWALQNP